MTKVLTLNDVISTMRQRREALSPLDVTDQLQLYQFKWPEACSPVMARLTNDRILHLSPRAESQLLQRAGIPAPFFRKLPENLKWAVANHLVQHGDFERAALMRTVRGNTVRALLTEAYTPLDDIDVMPLLADILADEDMRIERLDFSEDYTHLRAVFLRETSEPRKGDIVMTGLNISNSETGCRAVHIDAMVYRLVCTNGLVQSHSSGRTTIRHIGQPERLKDYLVTAVHDAKHNAHQLVHDFKSAVDHTIAEPQALLKQYAQDAGMTREQLQAVLAAFAVEPDATAFGVVNAVTRAAQAEETFEARFQQERLGAQLLARLK